MSAARALVHLPVGLPGSGKTHWARKKISEHLAASGARGALVRISRDDLRRQLTLGYHRPERGFEDLVTDMRDAMLVTLISRGCCEVILDETNLNPSHFSQLTDLIRHRGAHWEVVDFTDVPLEACIARDARRSGVEQVGEEVIRGMHERFIAPWTRV